MWSVRTTDFFVSWFNEQDRDMQLDILAALNLLKQDGPHPGRPYVDTVYASKIVNMKELRVQSHGRPIRAFFVSTPNEEQSYFALEIKRARMKNVSIRR